VQQLLNCQHDFRLYFCFLVLSVYNRLALHHDLSELEEPSVASHQLCASCLLLLSSGECRIWLILGKVQGDMAEVVFAITFAEDGEQLPSSFGSLHG